MSADEPGVFPSKWAKVIKSLPEFKEDAEASSPEELEDIIVKCEGNIYNIDAEKVKDIKLNAAKEMVKDLGAGYRDAIKVQTAKLKYALHLLESKGKELGGSTESDGN